SQPWFPSISTKSVGRSDGVERDVGKQIGEDALPAGPHGGAKYGWVEAVEQERFLVGGGARLSGQVRVAGAKNSVLKLMAAALLAEGTTVLRNCPEIDDVPLMQKVLEGLGCQVERDGSVVAITTPRELSERADFEAVRQFRASVC